MRQVITSAPSPNHDERTLPISILVLHYTGMESGTAALARMTDAAAKVSAHYMVEEGGEIFQLVDEDRRAWHAGVSEWNGITNVNSASVGIEIVNGGHDYGLPDFPDPQINAVIALSKQIVTDHAIKPRNIVAHSDIAPARKEDPGEKFPWAGLAAAGLGLWPGEGNGDQRHLFGSGDRDRGVAILQHGLAQIGYAVSVSGEVDEVTTFAVKAFQRRYRPQSVTGLIDMETYDLVARLVRLI